MIKMDDGLASLLLFSTEKQQQLKNPISV